LTKGKRRSQSGRFSAYLALLKTVLSKLHYLEAKSESGAVAQLRTLKHYTDTRT